MKAALLGHGTIGVGVDRIASGISCIDITRVLALETDDEIQGRHTFSVDDIVNDPSIDTVIEVMGGIHPAWEFISRCMEAGKNVVTANKAVVAAYYREMIALSEKHHVALRTTAAVGGGIPWLVNLSRTKAGDEIQKISGIMNGTTNYILSRMDREGAAFPDMLKEAQELGYAEKDPSADIDGDDVRRKLCISAGVAFDCAVDENDIPTAGIRFVKPEDLAFGHTIGHTLKLLAVSEKTGSAISAYVVPAFIPDGTLLAAVPGNLNLLSLTAKNAGTLSFAGQGAGRFPTAENVILDLLDIENHKPTGFYTDKTDPTVPDNSGALYSWVLRSAALSDFPDALKKETNGCQSLTEKISVKEFFRLAEMLREKDPALFFAAVFE